MRRVEFGSGGLLARPGRAGRSEEAAARGDWDQNRAPTVDLIFISSNTEVMQKKSRLRATATLLLLRSLPIWIPKKT